MRIIEKIKDYLSLNKNLILINTNDIGFFILKNICEKITTNYLFIESSYDEAFNKAEINNGICVSPLTREHIGFCRLFDKRTSGNMDVYPFGDLFIDQLIEIAKILNLDGHEFKIDYNKIPKETSIGFLDIKKYDILDKKNNIIYNNQLPFKYEKWYLFTLKQKEQIIFLHNREKMTRHKAIHENRILRLNDI